MPHYTAYLLYTISVGLTNINEKDSILFGNDILDIRELNSGYGNT